MSRQRKTLGAGKQPRAFIKKSQWRHCIAAVAKDLLPWWLAGAAAAVALTHCSNSAHAGQSAKAQSVSRGTVSAALKGAGARHTISVAEAAPAWEKRGFVTSRHGADATASALHGFGRDGAIRKDARTATDVCLTSRPPYALRQAAGGFFNVPVGA